MNFKGYKFDKPAFLRNKAYKTIGYETCVIPLQEAEVFLNDLKVNGCSQVFQEDISQTNQVKDRCQFRRLISLLRKGDEIVVARLDRLGNREDEIIECINQLQNKGIYLRTLDGLVNTRLLDHSFSQVINFLLALSKVESSFISRRNHQSTQLRKYSGANLGGRPKISKEKESNVLRLREKGFSYRLIRKELNLSLSTIRRIILDNQSI